MTRRELLASSCVSIAAAMSARASGVSAHELDFASALDAAAAIKAKKVSSVELTRRTFERIDKFNPKLNAFVYQMRDQALAQARQADEAVSRGASLGVFHASRSQSKNLSALRASPTRGAFPRLKVRRRRSIRP